MHLRLFWKVLLALWVSMVLSVGGTFAYFHWRHGGPPGGPPPEMRMADVAASGASGAAGRPAWDRGPNGGPGIGPGPGPGRGPGPGPGPRGMHFPIEPLISGALASLLISVPLAWYLSQPIRHLRWALSRVAQEDFGTRVAARMGGRRDELVDLAHDFDRMAEQLQRLSESRRQLLHDISHELRSPLSRLQAAVGLARQSPARTAELLDRIQRETERLDHLIDELLTLHRLEADTQGAPAHTERVDVAELLQAVVDDAALEAEAMGRHLVLLGHAPFVAQVDGALVCRAFDNVVRNALKFSPLGGRVEVDSFVDANSQAWRCTVRDRGPGVPEAMLEAIFQPFMRVEGSEAVRGTGLGLAIARRAVSLHGGRIWAEPRTGGGLVMHIELPASLTGAAQAMPSAFTFPDPA